MGVVPVTEDVWLALCSNTSSNVGGGVLQHDGAIPTQKQGSSNTIANITQQKQK